MAFHGAEPNDPVDYIQQTHDSYAQLGYDAYRWAHNPEPSAFVSPTKPLDESSLTLIASGGVYAHGQVGFTHKDDLTFREVPTNISSADVRVTHFAYDQTNAKDDPNVVFPIEPLRAMVASGELGSLTPSALTFMGGIYSQRRLKETLIPAMVQRVVELGTDLALLVPV